MDHGLGRSKIIELWLIYPDGPCAREPPSQKGMPMFIATSTFTVRHPEMTEQVKEAFRKRPHLVDDAAGFVRVDILSPSDNPDRILLITFWKDEESFTNWHRSHRFRASHRWIPKGLKLVPKSVRIRTFEHIGS